MNTENKRHTGQHYEKMAADYLQKAGLKLLKQNFYCRQGEIDLILRDGPMLVFVEVKYRSSRTMGDPAEAVIPSKQRRIRSTAQYYLYSCGYGEETRCRFDVICILGDQISWIRDAF